jgi:hypothetical protein
MPPAFQQSRRKRETGNPALIAVEIKRQQSPGLDIDWEEVANQADYCEWPVNAKSGERLYGG